MRLWRAPSRYPAPSARNVARVMTRTSLGFARPGSVGAAAGSTELTTASVALSGLQANPETPSGWRVSGRESPPDRSSANTCGGSAWPPLIVPRTDERQHRAVRRPSRRRVARAGRQRSRLEGAVGGDLPDRAGVGVVLAVDGHADHGDRSSVGRELRVGQPDEVEQVEVGDRALRAGAWCLVLGALECGARGWCPPKRLARRRVPRAWCHVRWRSSRASPRSPRAFRPICASASPVASPGDRSRYHRTHVGSGSADRRRGAVGPGDGDFRPEGGALVRRSSKRACSRTRSSISRSTWCSSRRRSCSRSAASRSCRHSRSPPGSRRFATTGASRRCSISPSRSARPS